MSQPIELSLEQQFSIRTFETQVKDLTVDQAKDFLVQLYRQMMMREATYKQLLKHQWGIESGNPAG
ncbi:NblA/ycf18 family protein [Merismopedia glauca]|uniref:NblA-related protein n=1 Tax=Merismopedia glauca CCAP 1448/3 TaxID=1296344 RepID=A0A2T1CA33_9CYAN|nr:NblA/ycf18 family protein [Merismopedia glauca]PSB05007.1 NblA-related protein [Merismopedia glauca CCAP 1448/3]